MQQEAKIESPLKRFMKTKWFWLVYVVLLSVLASLILVYMGCFADIFVPIFMFAIPFWLREKNLRRYLLNGIIIAFLTLFIANLIFTAAVLAPASRTIDSVQQGTVTLSGGTVTPYKGSESTIFNFSVVYTNTLNVPSSSVHVNVSVYDYVATTNTTYSLTSAATGASSNGWTFYRNLTLPAAVYLFGFEADTTVGGNVNELIAGPVLGPVNAPWLSYFSAFLPIIVFSLILPISAYYIIVGLYWWFEKSKSMRGTQPPKPWKVEEKGDFECTNCGATVPEDATKCPRCGAIFEEDEEPREAESDEGKEKDLAFKQQEEAWKKQK